MTKVTKADCFKKIKGVLAEDPVIVAFCEHEIELIDRQVARAREKAAEKAKTDPIMDEVKAVLTDEFQTISQITNKVTADEVTEGKVRYRLTRLVDDAIAVKDTVKVADATGKVREVKGYKLK